ncbi:MAG: putative bifunctional diguanylate cyclase/phosphodiesterase [Devosia sp.]
MQSTRTGSGRSFSLVVLGSVFVVFAATAALLGGFVFWSSGEVDNAGVDRQATRIVRALSQQLAQVSHDQKSVAVWDGTLSAVTRRDLTWLNHNVGRQMASYFQHSASYILEADGRPLYAAQGGRRVDAASYGEVAPVIAPMLDELRSKTRRGYADIPPSIADFVVLDGGPAIVGVFPIVSADGDGERPGEEPILVSVIRLDLNYELGMIDRYMLEAGRFTTKPGGNGLAALPVTNRAGRIIAFYEWQPYLPGSELLRQTTPALAGGFAVLGLVVALLLYRLWRSSRALESKRIDAERQAMEDPLTHLPNRLSFEQQFDGLIREPQLSRPLPRLLMLDLDRFKQVNDTLGHHAGDDLIRAVGERLRYVVGPDAVLARLGGDEFAILCMDSVSEPQVMELCRRIIEAIARPFRINGNEAFVGVSIGVVMARAHDRNRHELTRKADIALYEAKSSGRNRAAIYEESMNELVQTRHSIEAELREALKADDQLWVAFQPLFGRKEDEIVGAEALVRWTHPRRGPVSPMDFVPIAESSGLIETLGDFVLRRACEMGARWPGHTIAVNISPAQMRNPTLAERIFAMLGETGMRPEDLEIEITESILLDDGPAIADAIRSLREAGIKIALDDFGTGYSSLNYLKRYPVDRIKIDRSFISQLSSGSASTAIVQALVTLAHALDIEVTAEGVETDEQYRVLASMGCNTFQGYRFSLPLHPDALDALLEPAAVLPAARVA